MTERIDDRIEMVRFFIDRYKADFGINLAIVAFFLLFFRVDGDATWSDWKTAGAISISCAAYALIVMGAARSELLDTLELLIQEKALGKDVGFASGVGPSHHSETWLLYPFKLIGRLFWDLPVWLFTGLDLRKVPLPSDEDLPGLLVPIYTRVAAATLGAGFFGIVFFLGFMGSKYG